jgi:hypothetical protein
MTEATIGKGKLRQPNLGSKGNRTWLLTNTRNSIRKKADLRNLVAGETRLNLPMMLVFRGFRFLPGLARILR